jgi:galactose-1-phosphate uridylyltransferase
MKFDVIEKETVILNPLKDFAEKRIKSEIRIDPLTGRSARICHFMKLKWEKPDLEAFVAGTDAWCPFCSEKVLRVTPCFPDDILPEGRMQKGDMVLFPNIAPYDSISALATFGSRHHIPMTAFSPEHMAGAFGFALDFFRRIEAAGHPEAVYHIINWNYMPPAGSSLIHPHLQVFSTASAPNLLREELAASRGYFEQNGTTYWDDLVGAEKNSGRRYLGRIGRTHWMTAFAPMGVAGDVLAVMEDVPCTLALAEGDLLDIGRGLAKVMAGYDRMGIYSFNMNLFTGQRTDTHFRVYLRFSPRTFFNQKLGTPDVGALQFLYNESVCLAHPEEICEMLKGDFQA